MSCARLFSRLRAAAWMQRQLRSAFYTDLSAAFCRKYYSAQPKHWSASKFSGQIKSGLHRSAALNCFQSSMPMLPILSTVLCCLLQCRPMSYCLLALSKRRYMPTDACFSQIFFYTVYRVAFNVFFVIFKSFYQSVLVYIRCALS